MHIPTTSVRIRLDLKLFGLKDQDPKLLILDLDLALDPVPSLFHTKLRNMFLKCTNKCKKFIIISNTILEKFKKLKISTHLCLVITQN